MATLVYSLHTIGNIIKNNNSTYKLPIETLNIINKLSESLDNTNYKKNSSSYSNKSNKNKRKNTESVSNEDWESVRKFEATKMTVKEGIEEEIDNMRILINKLTETSYDKISIKIIELLDTVNKSNNYDKDSIYKIGYTIFNIASSNKFNSTIYANLCSELKIKFDFITDVIDYNLKHFTKMFENIEFVSHDEDYDKFCELNIMNDKRCAMTLFLTNLYKYDIITIDYIESNINNLQNSINKNMNEELKLKENEELVENLYILLTNIDLQVLKNISIWNTIYDNITKITNIDIKMNKGISFKCKFKHMDILDKIK